MSRLQGKLAMVAVIYLHFLTIKGLKQGRYNFFFLKQQTLKHTLHSVLACTNNTTTSSRLFNIVVSQTLDLCKTNEPWKAWRVKKIKPKNLVNEPIWYHIKCSDQFCDACYYKLSSWDTHRYRIKVPPPSTNR